MKSPLYSGEAPRSWFNRQLTQYRTGPWGSRKLLLGVVMPDLKIKQDTVKWESVWGQGDNLYEGLDTGERVAGWGTTNASLCLENRSSSHAQIEVLLVASLPSTPPSTTVFESTGLIFFQPSQRFTENYWPTFRGQAQTHAEATQEMTVLPLEVSSWPIWNCHLCRLTVGNFIYRST